MHNVNNKKAKVFSGHVKTVEKYGLQIVKCWICDESGAVVASSVFMSEQGARTWIDSQLSQLEHA